MTTIPADWLTLLRLLPGYDPLATAGDSWFDVEAAEFAIGFFEECLVHVEGTLAGKPFLLQPHQKAFVANLFGWKRRDAAGLIVRRYREAILYEPRKNGKTPIAAGITLLVYFTDDEQGQQDYLLSSSREQAGKLFRLVKGMVQAEPELSRRCRIYGGTAQAGQSKSIVRTDDPVSFLQLVSADAETQHGGNTHLAVVEELHTMPGRDLVDVIKTSMASANRRQPLLIYVTTADFQRPSVCNEIYDYACKVRDGVITDPSFLPAIYEALPTEDWTSEAVWAKANPNLGVSVSLEYLRRECARAQEVPAYENTFRRLHLNQRTETDVKAIPMDKWDAVANGLDPVAWRREVIQLLKGIECVAGLDLGATSDLTALALLFQVEQLCHIPEADLTRLGIFGKSYVCLPYFWCPKESAEKRSRRDRVPYTFWAREGFITLTEGEVTDYSFVRKQINDCSYHFYLRELAADRWNATQIVTDLQQDGANIIAYGQGFKDMAAPTKAILEMTIAGQIQHGGNPVLRWMASNASTETDAAGNLKFSKKKSTEKIDGLIAETMALGRALLYSGSSVPDVIWI